MSIKLAVVVYCIVGSAVLRPKRLLPLSEIRPATKVSPMGYTEHVIVRDSAIDDKQCPATQETLKFLGGNLPLGRVGGLVTRIDLCPVNVIDMGESFGKIAPERSPKLLFIG